jgi:hypothetical protein
MSTVNKRIEQLGSQAREAATGAVKFNGTAAQIISWSATSIQ